MMAGAKIAVSLGAVIYLWWIADNGRLWQWFARIDVWHWGLAMVLVGGTFLIGAWRWRLLLAAHHTAPGYWRLFPSYYLGLLFNQILPTGIAGDVVRTACLHQQGLAAEPLIASAVAERVVGLVVVVVLCVVLWVAGRMVNLPPGVGAALVAVTLFMVVALWFFTREKSLRMAESLAGSRLGQRRGKGILAVWRLCRRYAVDVRLMLAVGLATVISVVLNSAAYFVLARALGDQTPFGVYMLVVPLAMLAGNLPVSLGGLGVREGALAGLLVAVGVELELAVSLAFLYLAVLWSVTVPAVVVWVGDRLRARREPRIDQRPFR